MKNEKDEKYWQEKLSPTDYAICRLKGTEPAFTGEYYENKEVGVYLCKCCGQELFKSDAKYDSGSGWPSFYKAAGEDRVETHADKSHMMVRTEITCSHCGCHLGHVFDDGPKPTGQRFCVNSASLKFKPEK